MTELLLFIVGLLYVLLAGTYFLNGNIGMAVAFICYAFANIGLYIAGGK